MSASRGVCERVQLDLTSIRTAQARWADKPVTVRLRIVRALRHDIAEGATDLAATVPFDLPGHLRRTLADTLCSEVLPLAEACRYLERKAESLLAPKRESNFDRPLWLAGASVETRRQPLGVILILGPGNYPLFLPGAQALQALVAGNAVVWKPAPGGTAAAIALRTMLLSNGLDPDLLTILDESREAAHAAIEAGIDKAVLTGSAATGRTVLRTLAEKLTPSVMELSGCDAVFVLEGADLERVVDALAFGLRFNGSATCMAPRRLILSGEMAARLLPLLTDALRAVPPVQIPRATASLLRDILEEAVLFGATIEVNGLHPASGEVDRVSPILISNVSPSMRAAQADIFAPLLSVLIASNEDHAIEVYDQCPYALTAAVFGPAPAAAKLSRRIHAGTVLINDLIVSAADPRASFGGLGSSGFGTTRGAAGLLEMTSVKTIIVQRGRDRRAYQPTTPAHGPFFAAFLRMVHGRGWRSRLIGLRELAAAARGLKQRQES